MSDVNTQKCDECGILKREVNNWYHAATIPGQFIITSWDRQSLLTILKPCLENSDIKILDICSESCAVKAMSKAIGRQQNE
jgi:hypothetical protein